MFEERSFWEELRQRRVVRVAIVYGVVGWGVFEGSMSLTEAFTLPDFTPRLVLGLLVLGFPLALALTWALQVTPEGIRRERPFAPGGASSRLPFFAGLALGVLAVGALAFLVPFRSDSAPRAGMLDGGEGSERVVVMPFRVGGVPEDLSWLGVGFQELLYTPLDGDVGPRAIEPTTVNAVDAGRTPDANTVARRLGAALMITGSVVGSGSNVVVQAVMEDTAGTRRIVATAEGHPDSHTSLAREIVGELLSLSEGEYTESLEHLTSTSPGALEAYLRGKDAWRNGQWHQAVERFARAMSLDTTFALAGLAHADGLNMAIGAEPRRGLELAWRHRDRLSRRDRMYLEARRPAAQRTWSEALDDYEQLTRELPDRIEAWYWLGEARLHLRNDLDPEWPHAASEANRRALELNPRYFPAFEHLIVSELAHANAETLRDLTTNYLELRDNPVYRGLAAGTGRLELDTAALADPETDPNWVSFAPLTPVVWPDRAPENPAAAIDAALRVLRRRVGDAPILTPEEAARIEYGTQVALGRPGRARRAFDDVSLPTDRDILHLAVWDGVFVEMSEATALEIEERLRGAEEVDIAGARDLFAVEVRRYAADPSYAGSEVAMRIRDAADGAASPWSLELAARALLLEAWRQVRAGDPTAEGTLDRVDALIAQGPRMLGQGGNRFFLLSASRVYEELDAPLRALRTLDRRSYVAYPYEVRHEVEILRRMGAYAAAAGDTTRALREYGRYLTLREDPEPSMLGEVDAVRAEVVRLEDGRS